MSNVVAFRPRGRTHGVVWLAPVDENGGAWGAYHQLSTKCAPTYLGSRFSFDEAERFAKAEARRLRAVFNDGSEGAA